jgi:hypothetical protein
VCWRDVVYRPRRACSRARAPGASCELLCCGCGSRVACPGSWILSPSCRAVPALGVMLCAPFLPPSFPCLGRLLRTTLCPWVRVCSLLGSCVALCVLLRCRLRLVLLRVAPSRSAPLGVLRPTPRWCKAWSPTCFFFAETTRARK